MIQKVNAGSEILYACSRCGLDLWHTVLAVVNQTPVRVRCNTCRSERNYRAPKPERVLADRPRRELRPKASGSHPDFYQQKLQQTLMKTPKNYRIDIVCEVDDVIDHVKFGRGVVLKIVHPDRMDVLFQDETRTLVRAPSKA